MVFAPLSELINTEWHSCAFNVRGGVRALQIEVDYEI
jgi:hypothetical protein